MVKDLIKAEDIKREGKFRSTVQKTNKQLNNPDNQDSAL